MTRPQGRHRLPPIAVIAMRSAWSLSNRITRARALCDCAARKATVEDLPPPEGPRNSVCPMVGSAFGSPGAWKLNRCAAPVTVCNTVIGVRQGSSSSTAPAFVMWNEAMSAKLIDLVSGLQIW